MVYKWRACTQVERGEHVGRNRPGGRVHIAQRLRLKAMRKHRVQLVNALASAAATTPIWYGIGDGPWRSWKCQMRNFRFLRNLLKQTLLEIEEMGTVNTGFNESEWLQQLGRTISRLVAHVACVED